MREPGTKDTVYLGTHHLFGSEPVCEPIPHDNAHSRTEITKEKNTMSEKVVFSCDIIQYLSKAIIMLDIYQVFFS